MNDPNPILSVGVSVADGSGGPRRWILILADPGAEYGTWYYLVGPPHHLVHRIEPNRLVNSPEIESLWYVATIPVEEADKVRGAALFSDAVFCQRWVVSVLNALESWVQLLPPGTARKWRKRMQKDPHSRDGGKSNGLFWEVERRSLRRRFPGSMEPIFLRLSVEPKEVLDLFDALRKQSVDAITDSPFVDLVRAGSMSALS